MSMISNIIEEITKKRIKSRMAVYYGLDINDPDFDKKYQEAQDKEQIMIDKEEETICPCCGQEIK